MLTTHGGSRIKVTLGPGVENKVMFKKVTLKTGTMIRLVGAQRWAWWGGRHSVRCYRQRWVRWTKTRLEMPNHKSFLCHFKKVEL